MTKPWERQKNESSKSFAWFEIYLHLGANRKLKKIIEKVESINKKALQGNDRKSNDSDENIIPTPTLSQLETQSFRWHWSKRARAYDNYLSNLRRQRKEEAYLQSEDRLIKIGEDLATAVEEVVEDLRYTSADESKATSVAHALSSASKAYDNAVKNIRLLYGRSTENKETNAEVNLGAEVDTNQRVEVDFTSDSFMENELEYMRKLMDKK